MSRSHTEASVNLLKLNELQSWFVWRQSDGSVPG